MDEVTKEEMLKEVDDLVDELKGVEKPVPAFKDCLKALQFGLEQLELSYAHREVYTNTMITTLQCSTGQQEIRIKKLEDRIKEIEEYTQEGWDFAESYTITIEELEEELRGKDGTITKE